MTTRPTPVPLSAPLPIRVSMEDPEPMYAQIGRQLRGLIVGGHLKAGTQLPSVRALAHDLSCSVITTRRAYQDLEQAGFIRTRQGMGTMVAELDENQVEAHRRNPVERAFAETIREARDAGMRDDELRKVFEAVLRGEGDTP